MSQTLHLNFLGRQQQSPRSGWLLLAIGLALVTWQLLEYSQALQINSELRSDLQSTLTRLQINKDDVKRQPVPTPQERSALTLAKAATAQLNYPWDALLSLIETTQHPDVALLALDPKSRNGQIRLTAEAKNEKAMVAYVAGLQQNSMLQSAVLTTQQLQIQLPGTPLKFQILAQWKGTQAPVVAAAAMTNPAETTTSSTTPEKGFP